jgi:hypothetical protein
VETNTQRKAKIGETKGYQLLSRPRRIRPMAEAIAIPVANENIR